MTSLSKGPECSWRPGPDGELWKIQTKKCLVTWPCALLGVEGEGRLKQRPMSNTWEMQS